MTKAPCECLQWIEGGYWTESQNDFPTAVHVGMPGVNMIRSIGCKFNEVEEVEEPPFSPRPLNRLCQLRLFNRSQPWIS
jgi:hypothetical protein